MDINIDFLKKPSQDVKVRQKKQKTVLTSFMALISIYLIAILGLFVYGFTLGKQAAKLDNQISVAGNEVKRLNDIELMTIMLNQKMASLKGILVNQKDHHELASFLLSVLPEGVSIEGYSVTSLNTMNFNGTALGLGAFDEFGRNIFAKQASGFKVSKAAVSGFAAQTSDEGELLSYKFSISLSFDRR